jgi:hypothetical protein
MKTLLKQLKEGLFQNNGSIGIEFISRRNFTLSTFFNRAIAVFHARLHKRIIFYIYVHISLIIFYNNMFNIYYFPWGTRLK